MSPGELLQRIAWMAAHDVSAVQIAAAFGISEEKLALIRGTDEYASALQKVLLQKHAREIDTEDDWDSIEKQALSVVKENIRFNRDPDFALKVARVANDATRRATQRFGGGNVAPPVGGVVVVQLQQAFADRMSAGMLKVSTPVAKAEGIEKQVDMLEPSHVERMMGSGGNPVDELEEVEEDEGFENFFQQMQHATK